MATRVQQEADLIRARVALSSAFIPSGPVNDRDLFAGRIDQVSKVLRVVGQEGQHVILYGERGVGKTSLASLAHEFWNDVYKDYAQVIPARYNCNPQDTYATVWGNIAQVISDTYEKRGEDLPSSPSWRRLFEEIYSGGASPHAVRRFLDLSGKSLIIVIDEFDRVTDTQIAGLFASTIKELSDYLVDTTLVLVGVADTIDDLMEDHASVDRALVQVPMPPMSTDELVAIIEKGYERAGIKASPEVLDKMGRFAQGLPHYAHRFGQEAGYAALNRGSFEIDADDVNIAMQEAVSQTHETIRFAYHAATTSPQKDALFAKVLLACALAPRDDLGYFAPADVRDPLTEVVGKRYDIPQYISHLKKFCEKVRGPVLESEGEDYRRRYRFINPLMRTYVVLRGLQEEIIGENTIQRFEHADDHATVRGRQARLL